MGLDQGLESHSTGSEISYCSMSGNAMELHLLYQTPTVADQFVHALSPQVYILDCELIEPIRYILSGQAGVFLVE